MELGLVLTLCGLGAAFWLPAIIIGLISHGKKKNCTMNTVGLVIRINSKSSGDGSLSFYPVYEYYANGMKYTNERCVHQALCSTSRYKSSGHVQSGKAKAVLHSGI